MSTTEKSIQVLSQKLGRFLKLEGVDFAEHLDFAALPKSTKPKRKKDCKKGKTCGYSCVDGDYQCSNPLDDTAKKYAGWIEGQIKARAAGGASGVDTNTVAPKGKKQREKLGLGASDEPHQAYLEEGRKFIGQKRLKDLAANPDSPAYRKLQAERDALKPELYRLMDEDMSTAFKSPVGKRDGELAVKMMELEKSADAKAMSTMRQLRQDLIDRSELSGEEAKALAAQVKILKSATRELSEDRFKQEIAEFYQMTGGKGSGSFTKLIQDSPRAYATDDVVNIGKSKDDDERRVTLWHEMGHIAETETPEIVSATQSWIRSRATGEQKPLNELIPGAGYDQFEKAYPDSFVHPYVGKIYSDGTEAFSVGMEHFTSAENMLNLYKKDPEHFMLIVGAIKRKKR